MGYSSKSSRQNLVVNLDKGSFLQDSIISTTELMTVVSKAPTCIMGYIGASKEVSQLIKNGNILDINRSVLARKETKLLLLVLRINLNN